MPNPVGRPPRENSLGSKNKYDAQYVKDHYHRVSLNLKNEFYEEIKQCINDIPVNTFVKSAIREKLDRGSCKENVCVCYAVYENTSGEKVPVAFCKEREIAETMAALSTKYSVEVIEPSVISVSIL